jgi:hypothetical protein
MVDRGKIETFFIENPKNGQAQIEATYGRRLYNKI